MIDTKELRLKNIVRFIDGTISIVEAIGLGSVELKDVPYPVINTGISPIELTPEVLEACGFENEDLLEKHWIDQLEIGYAFQVFCSSEAEINIHYLHQLQNLIFAIDGEELTIDIDKLKNAVK